MKTYRLEDIEKVAKELILAFGDSRIIAFDGKMGAGKTTLIKEICRQLGSKSDINSPTFAIVNEYNLARNQRIFHFDFYRLNKQEEALELGIFDYLDSGSWCFLEWHEKIVAYLPPETVVVKIDSITDNERQITVLK